MPPRELSAPASTRPVRELIRGQQRLGDLLPRQAAAQQSLQVKRPPRRVRRPAQKLGVIAVQQSAAGLGEESLTMAVTVVVVGRPWAWVFGRTVSLKPWAGEATPV